MPQEPQADTLTRGDGGQDNIPPLRPWWWHAYKWGLPGSLFAICYIIQNMGLHVATHFYVQWMYRLRANLDDKEHNNEHTLSGERLSTKIQEGALHDVFAASLGYVDIPTVVLDGFAVMVPSAWLVWTVLKKDLHLWTKCCLCGALLAIGKGLLAVVTVVPDSTGWSHCKDRLGQAGVRYFKDNDNLNSRAMLDFFSDLVKLELLPGHKYRFCADMVYSGHTYFVCLFGLGLYDLARMSTINMDPVLRKVVRTLVACALCGIMVADVVCILVNRFHYSMDVILALMMTLLWYTNGAIAVVVDQWVGESDHFHPQACKTCGGIAKKDRPNQSEYSDKCDEFTIPPCCLPFCCVDGRYFVHRHYDNIDSYTSLQQQQGLNNNG